MDLLRHWRRRVFGAAASAVIVPVAVLLAALALGLGGSGLGNLGALGQAIAGPELPDTGPRPLASGQDTADEAGRLLARVQRDEAEASAPTRAERRAAARRRRSSSGGGRRTGGINSPSRPGGNASPAPTPSPTTAPQPTPAPTPTPTPSTVRQVGEQVKDVTDPVPVVGPPAGEVVDLIVDTAEQLPLPLTQN